MKYGIRTRGALVLVGCIVVSTASALRESASLETTTESSDENKSTMRYKLLDIMQTPVPAPREASQLADDADPALSPETHALSAVEEGTPSNSRQTTTGNLQHRPW